MQIKNLYIDADHLLYLTQYRSEQLFDAVEEASDLSKYLITDNSAQDYFMHKIEEYTEIAEVECVAMGWKLGDTIPIIGSADNFRKQLDPTYKSSRKSKNEEFLKLQAWARKTFLCIKGVEADDVVSHFAREGDLVVTTDKDVYKGVPGTFYDAYHNRWVYTTRRAARRFTLLQTVMGDSTDNIDGIKGGGEATALKLLNKYGWCWDGVIAAYQHHGLTEEDAILTRRLVDMGQWHPTTGATLWEP